MIAVIDYGMGNLRSVQKALILVGGKARVTCNPKDIAKSGKVVFPGVGAFGEAMAELKRRKLIEPIKEAIAEGRHFLGLCLGLQLLFEKSDEAPGAAGLCVLRGDVKRFKAGGIKVPHMGWNTIVHSSQLTDDRPKILQNVPDGSYMYFVHSYYVRPEEKNITITTTDYGTTFASGIHKGNIYGFQFHPEKSQALGLKILKNFVKL